MKQFHHTNQALLGVIFAIFLAPCVVASEIYQGLDISTYQGQVDFTQVKEAGYQGIYIRAGEGDELVDPRFQENYQGASGVGLPLGFYFYVTATNITQAEAQAQRFATLISGMDYQLRPAMDFESFGSLSQEETNQIALAFLEELSTKTGVTPVLYSDASNVETRWDTCLSTYPLWVADYENLENPEEYTLQNKDIWENWSGYQYTDSLTVPGIREKVDGNLFTSDLFLQVSGETPSTVPYVVQKGDTLWGISAKYQVSVDELVEINEILHPNLIYVGEIIEIPQKTTSTYTVEKGDTLWGIGKKFHTTVAALAEENAIKNVNLIFVGEVLYLPT